jgi:hypothetical protein
MSPSVYPIFIAISIADIGTLPLICWAWVSFVKSGLFQKKTVVFSAISLICASCSALLAIGTSIGAKAIGGFGFYDPRLMRIYFFGWLFSLTGIVFGIVGAFFRNSLRWQAPLAAFGTFLFWLGCAATE